jgi:5'-nucleotidase
MTERAEGAARPAILGFNDFHGQLSPRTVSKRPAGGAAVLAAYLEAARGGREEETIIVHAGDHVGASPASSALLQDEPAISVLNLLANDHCRYLGEDGRAADDAEATDAGRFAHRKSRWVPWLHSKCNMVGATGTRVTNSRRGPATGGNHPWPFSSAGGARYRARRQRRG